MMERLADILERYGLELNTEKIKMLSTHSVPDTSVKYYSRFGHIEHIAI